MNLLQRYGKWDELVEFNVVTGLLGDIKSRNTDFKELSPPFVGFIAYLRDHIILFYCRNEILHLTLDGKNFLLDEHILIRLEQASSNQNGTYKKLLVYQDDQLIFSLDYELLGRMIPGDPTPFVEMEDFDFGLFLNNVLANPKRIRLLCDPTNLD